MTQADTHVVPVNENGHEITESRGGMSGFQGSAGGVGALARHAGTASAVAREEAEIKAAIVLARGNPRDELASYNRLIRSCQRPSFAEGAMYRFPRGDTVITGPSVDMAREAARVWGNIRFGLRVVTEDADTVHIKGYAYDLESNNYVEAEDKFAKLVQRKSGWVKPDERNLRELINRRGAICVRNAILQLMPPDIIDDAVKEVGKTIRKAAAGELSENRDQAVRRLVMAFSQYQVTTEMLASHLGHAIDLINEDEMANLRTIFVSMRDGNSRREDHFEIPGAAKESGSSVSRIMGRLSDARNAANGGTTTQEPGRTTEQAGEPTGADGHIDGADGNGDAAGNAPDPQPAGKNASMFGPEPPSNVGPKVSPKGRSR